jgi:glycosyltransferase involved in cell wall biosynthesis
VPPSVSYWTGIWEPHREAISKEVDLLRHAFGRPARVVSFSSGQRSHLRAGHRVVRLSGDRWIVLRALAAATERLADITHVVGEMHAWHLLRALGRRPIVFTVVIPGPALDPAIYRKVSLFAAETGVLADALVRSGVPGSRIVVIPPGVDTARFTPVQKMHTGRFRVVFASSPASVRELDVRGVPLLVEAARRVPEIEVVLLWRRWGNREAADRALAALAPPSNVIVQHGDVPDMAALFQQADATAWLGAGGHGKSCPNSVIEGLACGCPAVVSTDCGIAAEIAREGAGAAVARTPDAVAAALRDLARDPAGFAARARCLAVSRYADDVFLRSYRDAYDEVLGAGGAYEEKDGGPRGLSPSS